MNAPTTPTATCYPMPARLTTVRSPLAPNTSGRTSFLVCSGMAAITPLASHRLTEDRRSEEGVSTVSAITWRKGLGLLYGGLAIACLLSSWIPAWHRLVIAHLGVVCFCGPAAWLIYGHQYVVVFVLGTVVCLFFFASGLFLFTGWQ